MTDNKLAELEEMHWKHDILGSIEVGILVLDRDFNVQLWNEFMQFHSGILPTSIKNKLLFDFFPEIDRVWFERKVHPIFEVKNPAFIIWEQRPYLFKFEPSRPVTAAYDTMFQNITLFPLSSLKGEVEQICVVVYDVTDEAVSKKRSAEARLRLTEMTRIDGLTNLYNRRYWEERCIQEFKRAQRNESHASLIMLDIDHFKKVNDTFGHPTGDQVIKEMSAIIKRATRETDIAGRYGGEEFSIILPETDTLSAQQVAERIRRLASKKVVEHDGQEVSFTVSLGVSQLKSTFTEHTTWIESADQCLYQAKNAGRNRSVAN
jgi:diguanylate cyclase (GGDEF)-like protein